MSADRNAQALDDPRQWQRLAAVLRTASERTGARARQTAERQSLTQPRWHSRSATTYLATARCRSIRRAKATAATTAAIMRRRPQPASAITLSAPAAGPNRSGKDNEESGLGPLSLLPRGSAAQRAERAVNQAMGSPKNSVWSTRLTMSVRASSVAGVKCRMLRIVVMKAITSTPYTKPLAVGWRNNEGRTVAAYTYATPKAMLIAKCISRPSAAYDGAVNAVAPTKPEATNCHSWMGLMWFATIRKRSTSMPPRVPAAMPVARVLTRGRIARSATSRRLSTRNVALLIEVQKVCPGGDVGSTRIKATA